MLLARTVEVTKPPAPERQQLWLGETAQIGNSFQPRAREPWADVSKERLRSRLPLRVVPVRRTRPASRFRKCRCDVVDQDASPGCLAGDRQHVRKPSALV